MATYVLVHGAWHTGELLEDTAKPIRAKGHQVHCPTLAGNRPGDSKKTGLEAAIKSLTDFFDQHRINDAVLMGHSYGGMVISGAADRLAPGRIRRLVYWNAFVPNSGQALNDMVPPHYVGLFDQIAGERGDGSVVLPFPIWREVFISDADLGLAQRLRQAQSPSGRNFQRQAHAQDRDGRLANREVLSQLPAGCIAAGLSPVASAAFGEARPLPPDRNARQPRSLLHQSHAARREDYGSGAGLGGLGRRASGRALSSRGTKGAPGGARSQSRRVRPL